jgi:predicted RNA-binding protein
MEGAVELEVCRRRRATNLKRLRFSDLRDDWYRGADLMARMLGRASNGEDICFLGFPRQWIPLFEYFRVSWKGHIDPTESLPVISDLDFKSIKALTKAAANRSQLRTLVESWAALDPLLSDVLYRLDRRIDAANHGSEPLRFTGWQSYGRRDLIQLSKKIEQEAVAKSRIAVLLPCARARPYNRSKTHQRIWRALREEDIEPSNVDQIVVSSIGVVPHKYWDNPLVLSYDSGVPDIYRILRLSRAYFAKARYRCVIDCLQFPPYSDCIAIIGREGLFHEIREGPRGRVRGLPRP